MVPGTKDVSKDPKNTRVGPKEGPASFRSHREFMASELACRLYCDEVVDGAGNFQ